MKRNSVLLCLLGCLLLLACNNSKVFDEVVMIPGESWERSNRVKFDMAINDTAQAYDILFHIRNGSAYEYSNLWMFVETSAPNGNVLRDTVELILAEPSGKWMGKGVGDVNSMLIKYKANIRFPYRGIYQISLEQAMREEQLKDILDVGVRVQKHKIE